MTRFQCVILRKKLNNKGERKPIIIYVAINKYVCMGEWQVSATIDVRRKSAVTIYATCCNGVVILASLWGCR